MANVMICGCRYLSSRYCLGIRLPTCEMPLGRPASLARNTFQLRNRMNAWRLYRYNLLLSTSFNIISGHIHLMYDKIQTQCVLFI
jgi:hypothetical protein